MSFKFWKKTLVVSLLSILLFGSHSDAETISKKLNLDSERIFSLESIAQSIMDLIDSFPSSKQMAQVTNSDGVKFTLSSSGLQALSYNGLDFISPPSGDMIAVGMLFTTPSGVLKPYGWLENSIDKNLNVGSSIKTTGTNPDYFEQIYRQGKEDSFTIKMAFTTQDSRTLKVDIYVTNNDPTDTLSRISLQYFLGQNGMVTPDYAAGNGIWLMVGSDNPNASPVAFVRGNSWGSMAFYTDDYNNHSTFYDVWTLDNAGLSSQAKYLFMLKNYNVPGGLESNIKSDPILPGQTYHYPLYIRFGSSSDTAESLASEAYSAYRNAFPYIVNWPDRRPITRWFIGDGARNSAVNPRSYFWDATFDVSDQSKFNTKLLSQTDDIIVRMNKMDPKPQGIVIWDLEGDEFNHYLTYVGNPNKLPDLAPEMNAVADQMFKKFIDAGYKVGLTLRPSNVMTGTTLPSTCNSDASNTDLRDVFIKTDAVYPNRGYACTTPNTWTQPGARNPWYQTCSWDDATILNTLRTKIAYSKNRWGVKIFYIDSTVYCGNGGGAPFSDKIIRALQQEFPDVLLAPENEAVSWFGSSAPYDQVNMGTYDTRTSAKYIYPQTFSVLANYDNVNFSDSTTRNRLIQSVKNGNIFMIDAWWDNPHNAKVLEIYREANGSSGATNPPSNPPVTNPVNEPVIVTPTPQPNNFDIASCSTILNACSSGTFADVVDTATTYEWLCTNSNQSSAVSCRINKSTSNSNTIVTNTIVPTPTVQANSFVNQNVIVNSTNNTVQNNIVSIPRTTTIYTPANSQRTSTVKITKSGNYEAPFLASSTSVIDITIPQIPSWLDILRDLILAIFAQIKRGVLRTVDVVNGLF